MQNQEDTKLFAFKLADKQQKETQPQQQWKARDGVAHAGCSGPDATENYRYAATWGGSDNGVYC